MAIANGYDPSNALLIPHAVDPQLHTILPKANPVFNKLRSSILAQRSISIDQHSAVGFCGRYWNRHTYTRRKNYNKIRDIAYSLAESDIPVIILGPNWGQLFNRSHKNLILLSAKYTQYPYIYNLMRIFVSLSIHEGGPLPLLESMCCGSYPIVTNTGFAFDVLKDCRFGELISPFQDNESILNLIKSRFSNPTWNINSIRSHSSRFSFDALAKAILLATR